MKGSREKDLTASLPSPTQASIRTLREHLDDVVHEGREAFLSAKRGFENGAWGPQCNATIVSGLSAPGPFHLYSEITASLC